MLKRYQVFVGSTLEDLRTERREIEKLIIEMGAVPVSLSMFSWEDAGERRIIQKAIEEADYFITLAAYRCGPLIGQSPVQELEYFHALKYGVPVIALIIDEKARRKAGKKDGSEALLKAMADFKKKLQNGVHETWLNQADLLQKARMLLIREMNLNPQAGWVRSGEAVKPELANELARLLDENALLKNRLITEAGRLIPRAGNRLKRTLNILGANSISLSFYYNPGENWENPRAFKLLKLFMLLAPELQLRKTTAEISRFFGNILNPDLERTLRRDYPVPSNTIKKILADFSLLKLVRCAGRAPEKGGENEMWEITQAGGELYAFWRIHQLERALKNKETEDGV